MKIFCNFRNLFFYNFKAIPNTLEGGLNNGKERYKPPVSDVSDCEMVAPTDSMEKLQNRDLKIHLVFSWPLRQGKWHAM